MNTPFSLPALMKSPTIKKYPANPIILIVKSSNSIRSLISSVMTLYLFSAPSQVICFKNSHWLCDSADTLCLPIVSSLECIWNLLSTGKFGSKISLVRFSSSTLSTISLVLSMASGKSAKTFDICSVVLKKNWSLGNANLLSFAFISSSANSLSAGVDCSAPVLMQSKISCALKSSCST